MTKLLLSAFFVLSTTGLASANEHSKATEHSKPSVSMEAAQKTALSQVPGGSIKEAELEKENGRLVYEFEVVDSSHRVSKIDVDANSGDIVGVEHKYPQQPGQQPSQQQPPLQQPAQQQPTQQPSQEP